MAYDANAAKNKLNTLAQLKALADRTKSELSTLQSTLSAAISTAQETADLGIKSVWLDGSVVRFSKTKDVTSGNGDFHIDFPAELVLDQSDTAFVHDFKFANGSYGSATDPDLDGKDVLVFAVKSTDAAGTVTKTYSFVDVSSLVDTYEADDKSIVVDGYKLKVNIKSGADNALKLDADNGLYVDVTGKADKVASATDGHLAGLDANGNLTDAGVVAADVVTKSAVLVDGNLVKGTGDKTTADSGIAVADVVTAAAAYAEADRVILAGGADKTTKSADFKASEVALKGTGDAASLAAWNSAGKLVEGGTTIATDAEVAEMLTEVFGAEKSGD